MKKECFKCHIEKPLSDFYKHSQMADGHLNKCKECTKTDVRQHRKENESVREYDRNRPNKKERQSLPKLQKYRAENPEKYKAHLAVSNALKTGRLVKSSSCEDCGKSGMIHGHHDDYTKPLEVRWLCVRCHSLFHAIHGSF